MIKKRRQKKKSLSRVGTNLQKSRILLSAGHFPEGRGGVTHILSLSTTRTTERAGEQAAPDADTFPCCSSRALVKENIEVTILKRKMDIVRLEQAPSGSLLPIYFLRSEVRITLFHFSSFFFPLTFASPIKV